MIDRLLRIAVLFLGYAALTGALELAGLPWWAATLVILGVAIVTGFVLGTVSELREN